MNSLVACYLLATLCATSGSPPSGEISESLDRLAYWPTQQITTREAGLSFHPPFTAPSETAVAVLAFNERPRDPWLGFDKVQHFTFSFLATLGGQYTLVNKLDVSEGRAWPVAASGSAAVGLLKEWYDWRYGPRRHFSTRDLVADGLGVVLAVGLILL